MAMFVIGDGGKNDNTMCRCGMRVICVRVYTQGRVFSLPQTQAKCRGEAEQRIQQRDSG